MLRHEGEGGTREEEVVLLVMVPDMIAVVATSLATKLDDVACAREPLQVTPQLIMSSLAAAL